jgi:hypothetical protein
MSAMEDDKKAGVSELKPGQTIHPGDAPAATPELELPAPQPTEPSQPAAEQPAPDPAPVETPAEPAPEPAQVETPVEANQLPIQPLTEDPNGISWTASEYVEHAKSPDWYLALAVVAILSAALLYFLFRDIITAATPLVAGLALGFYGRRPPRQRQYQLNDQGLSIDQKYYPYDMFRSFAIMDEGPFVSLVFLPLKRFGFLTTIYLDPQDEERIINIVSQHLPLEPREHDPIDRFMKRIRY